MTVRGGDTSWSKGEMRVLGRTGLVVSSVGLGLAALGRPAYITSGRDEELGQDRSVDAMRRRTHEVLDAAYAGGVRYFDAARSYGRAEEFLGSWLTQRGIGPGEVSVGSKWGYEYTGDRQMDADRHEVKDLSASMLRRQLGETRALLGEHLGLHQIHSATLESGVLEDHDVLRELEGLRSSGVAVGLSVTGPDQAETIDRALQTGVFDCVQATWNLLERSAEAALARAHEAGLGVIVKEALANGRLVGGDGDENIRPLIDAARERGLTPDALALSAALAQPFADVVLSGAATVGALRSNLSALGAEYDEALDRRLLSLREDPERYWSKRSGRPWT